MNRSRGAQQQACRVGQVPETPVSGGLKKSSALRRMGDTGGEAGRPTSPNKEGQRRTATPRPPWVHARHRGTSQNGKERTQGRPKSGPSVSVQIKCTDTPALHSAGATAFGDPPPSPDFPPL